MEITITWTKIIVLIAGYFIGRYLYYTFLKYYNGSPDPFDPTVFYESSSYYQGWRMGNIHGSQRMKVRLEASQRKLKALQERHQILQNKLSGLDELINNSG